MLKTLCKVSIIEDQKDNLELLESVINRHETTELISSYKNAEEALVFIPKQDLDIVIMDIGLPGMSGIDCLKVLKPQMIDTQFMMYTIFEEDDKIFDSLKYGACGYVLKTDNEKRIVDAVLDLYNGGSPMSPIIARKVVSYFNRPSQPHLTQLLSERELEVLSLIANGQFYKEIATTLNLTTGTIKQHIHRIYKKLQVQNRTEATNAFFDR